MMQNRGPWGGLDGSWSLSERLCRVLGHLVCVLRRLGVPLKVSWGRLGSHPGRILGSLGRVLGEFEAPLWASWGVLACLGASWGRLGIDFGSNGEVDSGISSWMPFSNRYPSDFASKNRSPVLEKALNSIGKICIFCFQAILR